ncbi:IPT/TIG domain-containing protein [bacterium]|nr:IPT/TIG domain-containing protein [bacterium]
MRYLSLMLVCVFFLAGCLAPNFRVPLSGRSSGASHGSPDLIGYVGTGPLRPFEAPAMKGSVSFASRRAQGTLEEVAVGATVSLINTGSNQTVITGLTDAQGNFVLNMPKGFRPDGTAVYYLEAFKGIGGNLPGNSAIRVRTVAMYRNNGWVTISSTRPNDGIRLSPGSTALAIAAALLKDAGRSVSLDQLIGRITESGYTPVDGLTLADFEGVRTIVEGCLADRRDPIAGVGFNTATNTWVQAGGSSLVMTVTAVDPTSSERGTLVTFTGQGFTPGSTAVVRFNGAPQNALSVSATAVGVTVPEAATSGQTSVQIGNLIALGPTFKVPVKIDALSRLDGGPGTSVTVTGTGFDSSNRDHNEVRFGGTKATVTQVTATSLEVTVPAGAFAGPVSVSVFGSDANSPDPFYPTLDFTSFSPTKAEPGRSITLKGTGFHKDAGSNEVHFGTVLAENVTLENDELSVKVPQNAVSGGISVTVNGITANLTGFVVLGTEQPFSNPNIQTIAGTTQLTGSIQATNWPISGRDIAIAQDGTQYVASPQGVYKVTTGGMASLLVSNAELNNAEPQSVACKGDEALYISTEQRIYRYTSGSGVTWIAGNDTWVSSGDGGTANGAGIEKGGDLALDHDGNVYFIDAWRIRKIDLLGFISTIAGNGTYGDGGDGGPAVNAMFRSPSALCIAPSGDIYIADTGNYRIRKINASGTITTVVGDGGQFKPNDGLPLNISIRPTGLTFGTDGLLYFSDTRQMKLRTYNPTAPSVTNKVMNGMSYENASGATKSLTGFNPQQVASSPQGEVYVTITNSVLKLTVSSGALRIAIGNETAGFAGEGAEALLARLNSPEGIAKDQSGNLYVADTNNNRVRKIDPNGVITTFAGDGTSGGNAYNEMMATAASLGRISDVAVSSQGVYIACTDSHRVWRVDGLGKLREVAGNGSPGFSGDGNPATVAQLWYPSAICLDQSGNLFIADRDNNRIRKVDTNGVITTVAGNGDWSYGSDGNPALSQGLGTPNGIACDANGRLYVSDQANHAVRRIEANGIISTVAGSSRMSGFSDGDGTAYSAQLFEPTKLVTDGENLYVLDSGNHCVRHIDAAGQIRTLAGTPQVQGFGNDGGSANQAQLDGPKGIFLDVAAGRLLVADSGNHRIRSIK